MACNSRRYRHWKTKAASHVSNEFTNFWLDFFLFVFVLIHIALNLFIFSRQTKPKTKMKTIKTINRPINKCAPTQYFSINLAVHTFSEARQNNMELLLKIWFYHKLLYFVMHISLTKSVSFHHIYIFNEYKKEVKNPPNCVKSRKYTLHSRTCT